MARLLRRRPKRILLDIDTQFDHFALLTQDQQSEVLRNIRRISAWARRHKVPMISTILSRHEIDAKKLPETRPICLQGSSGQKKIPYTTFNKCCRFGPDSSTDLPRNILSQYHQVIFEKRVEDPFEQPRADRLLTEMRGDELVVFGMDIENAIKATVLGLRRRRKPVVLVVDAIAGFNSHEASLALRQMEAKGARLVKTADIAGSSSLISAACLIIPA